MLELGTEVKYVKGVGPRTAEVLAEKNIHTVEDLLFYLPFRYEDRLNPRSIAELRAGEMASIVAEVRGSMLMRTRNRRVPIFQLTVGQGLATIQCIWFHGAYLEGKFKPGQVLALYGKVDADKQGRKQMIQPQIEIIDEAKLQAPTTTGTDGDRDIFGEPQQVVRGMVQSLEIGRIVPIYEAVGKLNSRWFRRVIHGALESLTANVPDAVPAAMRERLQLLPRREAMQKAHWPDDGATLVELAEWGTAAHRTLIFEELFFLELGLELKRRKMRQRVGIAFELNEAVRAALKRILPFHPTNAQKRVLKEIAEDMRQGHPMRRLLQGDVGSGKTIVALQAAIIAIENGYQAAIMAPTEILATQHYLSARRILEHAGYRIALLTGSLEQDRKRDIRRLVRHGHVQLAIGTHALIQQQVEFDKLGLVVVDEQHRFGVMQRLKLMKKSDEDADPDVLVMTATPIPRTLALTLYGDLDVSVLDEMPPGRTPIVTRRVPDERAPEVWDFVRKQVKAGYQAYVVYPVIEEGAMEGELKAAIKMYETLRKGALSDVRVGLLHGRMEADDKDTIMRRFGAGEIDVLVSTTVIEVGVDVPNANTMVIEHAERFGLAQLHQLRGRIGRGSAKSFCIMMTGPKDITDEAEERLATMVRTIDGFEIAETDLKLRGPGEFFGTKQAGMPSFRVSNLLRDRKLLEIAKREAAALVDNREGQFSRDEMKVAMQYLKAHWQRRYGLVEVG